MLLRVSLIVLMLGASPAARALSAPTFGVRYALGGTTSPVGVAIADINQDAIPDLVVVAYGDPPTAGRIATWFGRGDGGFIEGPSSATLRSPFCMVVGDVNLDGLPDVAMAGSAYSPTANRQVQVLLGQGDGTFLPSANCYPSDVGLSVTGIAIGDLDGNGTPDLATSFLNLSGASGEANIFPGLGDGAFGAPIDLATLGFTAFTVSDVAIGDVDGDGRLDVALATASTAGAFFLNTPELGWQPGNGPASRMNTAIGVGDLDADGKLDEVYAASDLNAARLRLGRAPCCTSDLPLNAPAFALAVGDIDGDGKGDIAALTRLPDNLAILRGHGDGTFEAADTFAVGARPYALATGDLNGDGLIDVVVANNLGNSVSVLLQGNPVLAAESAVPGLALAAPRPNPARGATSLTFEVPDESTCVLTVADVRGRIVETRALDHPAAGPNTLRLFEQSRPAPGVYWVRLAQGAHRVTRSFVLLP